jgi:hypothetical protein
MHDVHGKLITMFDKVRPATKEELEAAGSKESPLWTGCTPGVAIGLVPGGACCEVTVATAPAFLGTAYGPGAPAGEQQRNVLLIQAGSYSCKAVQLAIA